MKSGTSFCNATVLKKDTTRFLPVWLIYLVGGLLICTDFTDKMPLTVVESLGNILSYGMPIINLCYALTVALTLFGDLFKGRMCNALHAMPLRRETWFCTHYLSGLLLCAVPNLGLALAVMPGLKQWWYAALLWAGLSTLMYLFFFSLAVFCIQLSGNRFAATVCYALTNFVAMELLWLFETLILPNWNGVRIPAAYPSYLCPVVQMFGEDYFTFTYRDYHYGYTIESFNGLSAAPCGYLLILAAVGIALAAAAILLYRRRRLEVAGDFAAVAPVNWAVSLCGSLAIGMVFRLFALTDDGYALLFIGIAVGFLLIQMMLQRRVKIWNRPTLLKLGCLLLACAVILGCSALDVLGVETYVPKTERVEYAIIADHPLSDNRLRQICAEYRDSRAAGNACLYDSSGYVCLSDPADLALVTQGHALAVQEITRYGEPFPYEQLTIHYQLKSGLTVTRVYRLRQEWEAFQSIAPLLTDRSSCYFGTACT